MLELEIRESFSSSCKHRAKRDGLLGTVRPPQEVCFDLVLRARAGGAPLTLYQKDLADRMPMTVPVSLTRPACR
jgi:hypothetical protein